MADLTPEKEQEYKFRMRLEAEQEAESRRRTPNEMAQSKEYTGSLLPFRIDAEGKRHLAVPGVIQSAYQAITAPGRAIQSAQGDYVEPDKGGFNPQEEATNVALNAIPAFARGMKLPSMTARATEEGAAKAARMAEQDRIMVDARKEGYVTPPTSTLTGQAATMIAGKQPVKAAATIRNQEVTNKIARREAGLAENEAISDEALAAARSRIAQPYEELRAMSPKAGRLWDQLRQVRADSKAQWKFYNRSADPKVQAKARALDAKATALEGQIDEIAQLNFKPEMLARLRQARVDLAKNYQVERAVTPGGNVDAKAIARDVKSGKPVTGALKTVGEFEYARRPAFGVELDLEPTMHVGAGMGAEHFGAGAWFNHIPFAGSAARGVALSRFAQGGPPKYTPGLGVKLGDIASRAGPYGFAVVPQLGLRPPSSELEE